MEELDKINTIVNILELCLLPELSKELGTTDIKTSDFDYFRKNLDINLIELFHLIQRNENYLINDEMDFIEIKSKLMLLICEQTSPGADNLFQTREQHLLKNLNLLGEKHFEHITKDLKTQENIINFYRCKLNKETWKKNIGSVYGFLQFLIQKFKKRNESMDIKFSTFVLSVGLLLRDFYEPMYKRIGIQMFNMILKYSPKKEIKQMNIHKVIYEETFKDISKFEKPFEIDIIWNCLHDCLILMDDEISNSHKWTQVDDFIKNIINQIIFAKTSDIWLVLFEYLPKICLIANKNQSEMLRIINNNMEFNNKILSIRKISTEQSIISFRWIKSILELFGVESNYLMGNTTITLRALQIMHITFLICIFPIQFKIIEPHFTEFLEKWLLILMETLRNNKDNFLIIKNIKEFLETLSIQIEIFCKNDKSVKLSESSNTIQLLLNNEIFIDTK